MPSCSHPSPIKTNAGSFCMACGHLLSAADSADKAANKKPEPVKSGKTNPKSSLTKRLIKNFQRKRVETKKSEPETERKATIKVDSVSTPLLNHSKKTIQPTKK